MSNEISNVSSADVMALLDSEAQSKYATEKALSTVTKVGDWLPYIQLMSSNSPEVKRREFEQGHFALNKNRQKIDLGDSFVAYLLAWRPKAMIFQPPQTWYNPESEGFKVIEATADEPNSGKGYGPEFLIWLPERKDFALYFLGNKTGRNEAPNLISLINTKVRQCRITSHLIETKKHMWHGPKVVSCDLTIEMPDVDLLREEMRKFCNPPESELEPAEKAESGGRG